MLEDLFRWLFSSQGFFFLIIFGGWIVSSIGGAIQKAAKKASEQQARQQRRQRDDPGSEHVEGPSPEHVRGQMRRMPSSMGQMAPSKPSRVEQVPASPAPSPAPSPAAGPAAGPVAPAPSEAEIAREIRRLMGMEPAAPAQARPDPLPQPSPPSVDAEEVVPSTTHRHAESGHLAEEMGSRDNEILKLGSLKDRKFDRGSKIAERRLDTDLTRRADQEAAARKKAAAARRMALDHVLDLSRPATAFLAGEVFGKPIALKGWD